MSSVFSNNVVTQAGLRLIAEATATNPIVYVDALSASQIPQDPEAIPFYNGVDGIIDASSATDNTARIVSRFGNSSSSTAQPVKAIAITARLSSQSDSDKVIFAYCSDADSQIVFPQSSAPVQRTRFAFNLTFDGQGTVEVVEAGSASLSDLERFVSIHKAGNPNAGDDQQIRGSKTFLDEAVFNDTVIHENTVYLDADILPGQANTYRIGNSVGNRLSDVYTKTLHVGTLIGGDTIQSNWNVELGNSIVPESSTITSGVSTVGLGSGNARFSSVYAKTLNGMGVEIRSESTGVSGKVTLTYGENALMVDKDIVPADTVSNIQSCGRTSRPWKELYVRDAIHLTTGSDEFLIYEDDGGICFVDKYTSGGSQGEFFFEKVVSGGGLERATINAGVLYGAPMDAFKAKENTSTHALTVDIGAIILAIPPSSFVTNTLRSRINVGEIITIAADTWRVAEWSPGNAGSPTAWMSGSHYEESYWGDNPDDYTYLPAGKYRACHSIASGSNTYTNAIGAPIMLQRVP